MSVGKFCPLCGYGNPLLVCRTHLNVARHQIAAGERRGIETPFMAMRREQIGNLIVAVAALERVEDAYWTWEATRALESKPQVLSGDPPGTVGYMRMSISPRKEK